MHNRWDGARDSNLPAGQVRVLVVGDAGVGKTSLVHLIVTGKPLLNPMRTIGCSVNIKYMEAACGENQMNVEENQRRGFFVELWDVSGHEMYKRSRSLFYSQINGIIFVHDLSRSKSRHSAKEWTNEMSRLGTFNAPSKPTRSGNLPVPFLVIGNKSDLHDSDPIIIGSRRIMEAASKSPIFEALTLWAKRNNLIHVPSELPEYIRNSNSTGIVACAKKGVLDLDAIDSFFKELIDRRYFTEVVGTLPSPSVAWKNPSSRTISEMCAPSPDTRFYEENLSETSEQKIPEFVPALPDPRPLRLTPPVTPKSIVVVGEHNFSKNSNRAPSLFMVGNGDLASP